jgi:hypothetical protein
MTQRNRAELPHCVLLNTKADEKIKKIFHQIGSNSSRSKPNDGQLIATTVKQILNNRVFFFTFAHYA